MTWNPRQGYKIPRRRSGRRSGANPIYRASAVTPGSATAQPHALYGTKHSDLNTPLGTPATRQVIAHTGSAFDLEYRMNWRGHWTPGTYEIGDVVFDAGWIMIANTQTDDRPAPQTTADPAYASALGTAGELGASPAWATTSPSAFSVMSGQRYTFTASAYVKGARVWIPLVSANITYSAYIVRDPTGTPIVIDIPIPAPTSTGWHEIPAPLGFVADETLDLILVANSNTGVTQFNYDWTYSIEDGDPASGEIKHQKAGGRFEIRVHEEDDTATDRTADLDNIDAGSLIATTNRTWEVAEASKTGDVYSFKVLPAAADAAGSHTFTFSYYGNTTLDYVSLANNYSAEAQIDGILSVDGGLDGIATDDHGYGVDLLTQEAYVSPDWDFGART